MKISLLSFNLVLFGFLPIFFSCQPPSSENAWEIASPNGNLSARFYLESDSSRLMYEVFSMEGAEKKNILLPAPLGLAREDQGFFSGLVFEEMSGPVRHSDAYTMVTGKRLDNKDEAEEMTLTFSNQQGGLLNLVVRAYDEGIAFRYVFPEKQDGKFKVIKEYTSFQLNESSKKWIQPYDSITNYTPAYEKYYTNGEPLGSRPQYGNGWCFPALFETSGHWVLLSETDLDEGFYGSRLEGNGSTYSLAGPLEGEAFGEGNVYAENTLPWEMPWRFITVSKEISGIVESNMVHHLASPQADEDFSWVETGRASWSWWSDNDSPQDFDKLKTFIDFGSTMGWEYSLIDANWNVMQGGDVWELNEYAKSKSVGLWLWYNSGGPHNVVTEMPRDRMHEREARREEFKMLKEKGIKGIKVDFFQSDKQHIIEQYMGILEDAAAHQIMVNFHGCTIPRGWARTWPNLLTMESARGMETYIFGRDFPEKAPLHNVHLVFTRNVVGSMDYTPLAFSNSTYPRKTSYGHELALGVVFESGLVHPSDAVDQYKQLPSPVLDFIKDLPAVWEDTRLLAGHPSSDALVARKSGDSWYIGYINGLEESRTVEVDFGFLENGNFEVELLADGEDHQSFSFGQTDTEQGNTPSVNVLPFGGFVMKLSQK
ncbi:glycoside hydrolase family 97 protein [Pararhodonellum marinum]|uniref:glycoside hydrolase family 97 protein n=1 Tax=Pararhodonellum marinum TaxID=2755358 RepID=UPI00188EFAC1|nr:glycoside hydrolase family 97 protein [Pararhodonellum marinum]